MGEQPAVSVMTDDVEWCQQRARPGDQGGLLAQFAQSRLDDGLAALDLAARIAPQPRIRRVAALYQQNRVVPWQDGDRARDRPVYDGDPCISSAATRSKRLASASEKRFSIGLSTSSTPMSVPARISGTTISERELASQAMWPGKA